MYINDQGSRSKSREKKPVKKSRNNFVKTSRTKNDVTIYDESFSSTKRSKKKSERSKKAKNALRHSKLKININQNKSPAELAPQSAHGHIDFDPLMPNYTFQEKLKDQRHNILERMNRIETIISGGKSYDRSRDDTFNPIITEGDYIYDYNMENTPYTKRSTVSPIPSYRVNK